METKFNFKSQIATDKNQSKRLLALGLKKETADMWRGFLIGGETIVPTEEVDLYNFYVEPIPAWSLDRLMELVPHRHGEYCDYANNYMYYYNIPLDVVEQFVGETKYEYLIDCIEWLIKEGYFNKEYLEG